MPERIQRRRTKGWTLPENTVCVSRPSKWGNPFAVTKEHGVFWTRDARVADTFLDAVRSVEHARHLAVSRFKQELKKGHLEFTVEDVRRELKGKSLACWCPLPKPGEPDNCHAAVLLEVANS